jgi:hypothetical protein
MPVLQHESAETVRRENDLEHAAEFGELLADLQHFVHVPGRVGEGGIGGRVDDQQNEAFVLDRCQFLRGKLIERNCEQTDEGAESQHLRTQMKD